MAAAAVVISSAFLLSSCGKKPDFIVEISGDTKGVKPGSPVIYRGAEVGSVTTVSPANGKFRIEARLNDEYRSQIRDPKARVANGLTTQFNPQLSIIGSDDPQAPLLKPGQQVPEANVLDVTFDHSGHSLSPWAIGGVVLIFCIIAGGALFRGLVKIAIPIAGLGLVAAYLLTNQPEHRPQVQESAKNSIDDLLATAHRVLETPQNRAVWQASEQDVKELLEKAKGEGEKNLDSAKRQLRTSIDVLEKDANSVAVKELERLKNVIESVGNDKAKSPVVEESGK